MDSDTNKIYYVGIKYQIFKYRTKKGRSYLSKVGINCFSKTSSIKTSAEELQRSDDMLRRLANKQKYNPWTLHIQYEIKINNVEVYKEVGKTNITVVYP